MKIGVVHNTTSENCWFHDNGYKKIDLVRASVEELKIFHSQDSQEVGVFYENIKLEDMWFHQDGAKLILKWSETIQLLIEKKWWSSYF